MRPSELDRLVPTLERLATYGGARPDAYFAGWLRTVGAVAISPESDWAVPTTSWLDCATPANDALDLLRRTAVRDPGYRAHLDLVLASVLHTIGIAERWKRFEELIQGSLQPFSPRFVQLLEWLEGWTGTTSRALDGRVWLEAEALVAGPDAQSFSSWDATLWGASGNVSTVFALLQDHYIPLIAQPVHLCLDVLQIDQSSEQLLIALVEATRRTEGVLVSASQRDTVRVLLGIGVPLRVHSLEHSTQSLVGLIGRVSVSSKTKPEPEAESLSTRTWGNPVPDAAIRSVVANFERQAFALTSTFWAHVDGNLGGPLAFISIGDDCSAWPETEIETTPPWSQIPVAQSLRSTARSRRESPEADEALQVLAGHLFFGFVLQVLLLESLDRELGEETLVLAPPTDRRVDDIEAATRVFYRPRQAATTEIAAGRRESYDLGALDEVLSDLAKSVGLRGVSQAYGGRYAGPWSRAFRLLRSVGVVVGLHDRWSIADHVLDRLHGGGMMTGVIRRARPYRECLHKELQRMWTARHNAAVVVELLDA